MRRIAATGAHRTRQLPAFPSLRPDILHKGCHSEMRSEMRVKCTERSQNLAPRSARKYIPAFSTQAFKFIIYTPKGDHQEYSKLIALHTAFRSLIALVFRFADYVNSQPTNKKKKKLQWALITYLST